MTASPDEPATDTPAVAVVIPAYNAAGTLPETLASLRDQSFGDFRAIIVDDGSTDETRRVASDTNDPRITVLSVPNGGVAKARNLGIAASEGPFVAFLDADDLWHREKLALQVAALRANTDAGLCVTGAVRIDRESRPLGSMPLEHPTDVAAALLLRSMIVGCLSSGLVRRDLLMQAGAFNPQFSQSADWDLWLRLAVAGRFLILDEPLVQYRTAPGNMSSNIQLLERDTFAVLDAFFGASLSSRYGHLRPRAYSAHWLVCAGSHLHAGSYRDALRCLRNAVMIDPTSAGRALATPARMLKRAAAQARSSE